MDGCRRMQGLRQHKKKAFVGKPRAESRETSQMVKGVLTSLEKHAFEVVP